MQEHLPQQGCARRCAGRWRGGVTLGCLQMMLRPVPPLPSPPRAAPHVSEAMIGTPLMRRIRPRHGAHAAMVLLSLPFSRDSRFLASPTGLARLHWLLKRRVSCSPLCRDDELFLQCLWPPRHFLHSALHLPLQPARLQPYPPSCIAAWRMRWSLLSPGCRRKTPQPRRCERCWKGPCARSLPRRATAMLRLPLQAASTP